jgi:hypothetical protein
MDPICTISTTTWKNKSQCLPVRHHRRHRTIGRTVATNRTRRGLSRLRLTLKHGCPFLVTLFSESYLSLVRSPCLVRFRSLPLYRWSLATLLVSLLPGACTLVGKPTEKTTEYNVGIGILSRFARYFSHQDQRLITIPSMHIHSSYSTFSKETQLQLCTTHVFKICHFRVENVR